MEALIDAILWVLQAPLVVQAHEKMFSSRRMHEMSHIFHYSVITLMRREDTVPNAELNEIWTLLRETNQAIDAYGSETRSANVGLTLDAWRGAWKEAYETGSSKWTEYYEKGRSK